MMVPISQAQAAVIAEVVRGKSVHDFGAGNCTFAILLSQMGAREVIAIEHDVQVLPKTTPRNVLVRAVSFGDYYEPGQFEVGLISWPLNRPQSPDLIRLARQCELLIYVGQNTEMTATGGPDLFDHMLSRKLLDYVPEHQCTVIVLGEYLPRPRVPTGEELAGISAWMGHRSYTVDEAEAMAAALDPKLSKLEWMAELIAQAQRSK